MRRRRIPEESDILKTLKSASAVETCEHSVAASFSSVGHSPQISLSRTHESTVVASCEPLTVPDESKSIALKHMPIAAFEPGFRVFGLKNNLNTCYVNAVLQCVLHSTEFTGFFLSDPEPALRTEHIVAREFSSLVQETHLSIVDVFNPFQLHHSLKVRSPNHFISKVEGQQHDAHEFLVLFLDQIEADLNRVTLPITNVDVVFGDGDDDLRDAKEQWQRNLQNSDSIVGDTFAIQWRRGITCPNCKMQSVVFESDKCMILDFGDVENTDSNFLEMLGRCHESVQIEYKSVRTAACNPLFDAIFVFNLLISP